MLSFEVQDTNLRHHIRRLNRAMISAAAQHVGKSKPGRKTKPWSTPALRGAIKQRNTLRRTVQSNRVEYLAACGEARRLSEEARRAKWEEFLADLEGNPDPARAWNLIKSLSGSLHSTAFCEPLIRIRGPDGTPGMLTGKRSRKRLKNQCAPSKCKI